MVTKAKTRSVHQKLLQSIIRYHQIHPENVVTIDSVYDLLVSDRFSKTFSVSYHSERNEGESKSPSETASETTQEKSAVVVACDFVDVNGRLLEGLSEQFTIMR